jgi:hypothetical protein
MGMSFIWLFIISAPLWWFFEYLNTIVQNWHYLMGQISSLHYDIQSTISFTTVIPAVLSTAFLFNKLIDESWNTKAKKISKSAPITMLLIGSLAFVLMPLRPDLLFPFIWLAPFLILDPICYWLGFPSILQKVKEGRQSSVLAISIATLFTGFFWEMWNFWSFPKWYYTIPYIGFWKVFEMPVLGYGGYLFFGLIVWGFSVFVFSLLNAKRIVGVIEF